MSHLYMKGPKRRTSWGLAAAFVVWAAAAGAAESTIGYEPYVIRQSEGLPNGLNGRLKANGRSTKGNYSVVVRESQNAQAADAHTHSHLVEAWYVVEGAMTFRSQGKIIDAPAGTFVLVPPAVEHGFQIEAGRTVKLVQVFSPPGFENLFSERLKLPSYDAGKAIGEQSAQWKADQKDIARKYGAGPVEQPSRDFPVVRSSERGATSRVLASAETTAGHYLLEEMTLAPGRAIVPSSMSPEKDNAWYLLSGELRYHLRTAEGLQKDILRPGDFVFIPRGSVFDLSNASGKQEARFLRWRSTPRNSPSP